MSRSTIRSPEAIVIATDAVTEPFWLAARERRLVAPRCAACATFRFPPAPFCPACRSRSVEWVELGPGTVFSFTVIRGQPGEPGRVLVPAVVEFADAPGVHVVANIVDADPDAVRIGQRLAIDFVAIAGGWMLPVFRIAPPG